jgi:hypothetical protein
MLPSRSDLAENVAVARKMALQRATRSSSRFDVADQEADLLGAGLLASGRRAGWRIVVSRHQVVGETIHTRRRCDPRPYWRNWRSRHRSPRSARNSADLAVRRRRWFVGDRQMLADVAVHAPGKGRRLSWPRAS